MKKRVLILSLLMTFCIGCKQRDPNVFSIGSARISSNYYFIAEAIAENASQTIDGMKFTTVESNGSEDNVRGVVSDKYQLAIAQSDTLYDAFNAEGVFADEPPIDTIRAVAGHAFQLHQSFGNLAAFPAKDADPGFTHIHW